MLATEPDETTTSTPAATSSSLEQWSSNELMRHIPTLAWMAQKLDHDLRRRIEKLWLPYSDLAASDPHHPAIEAEFRALCRSLERVAVVAVRHRGAMHPPNDLGSKIGWLISHAVQCLNSAEQETFGRRFPCHTFERSNAEPLWAAMLAVIQHVQKLVDLVREIEPDIDERMYEGLVELREPLRREPIA
jgi:hypothetical protein